MAFLVNKSVAVSVGAASTRMPIEGAPQGYVRVAVTGAESMYVEFGDETVTATIASAAVPGGFVSEFRVGPGVTHLAVRAETLNATGTISFGSSQ